MADQSLQSYIESELEKDTSREDITAQLLQAGWNNEQIIEAFASRIQLVSNSPFEVGTGFAASTPKQQVDNSPSPQPVIAVTPAPPLQAVELATEVVPPAPTPQPAETVPFPSVIESSPKQTLSLQSEEPPTFNTKSAIRKVYTELDFPITTIWVFKYPIIMVVISVISIFFGIFFPYFLIAIPYFLIVNPLTRKNFRFSTEDRFLLVEQGILSKKKYNLPYGVIQNVFVKQDLFDKLFKISTVVIENAAQAGGVGNSSKKQYSWTYRDTTFGVQDLVGAKGNRVSMPGLKKADAESLKRIILQKITEHPIDDRASGL